VAAAPGTLGDIPVVNVDVAALDGAGAFIRAHVAAD
jgi:hypothetical protein